MDLHNLADLHTHSSFSPDAKDTAEQMCISAKEKGLCYYGISDHCDVNFWNKIEDKTITDYNMYGSGEYACASIDKVYSLKEKFPFLLCGVEIGQPLQNVEKADEISSDKRLDYVICSQHMNKGLDDFYYLDYDNMNDEEIDRLLDDYFLQLYDSCKWGEFEILAHLTYPLRYICGDGRKVLLKKQEEIIAEIFHILIENGKALEINCSGLRQGYGRTFPDIDLIKMYKNSGGEIITLGSDAHCVRDVGAGILQGAEIASNAGFRYISYYKNRRVEFIKIK